MRRGMKRFWIPLVASLMSLGALEQMPYWYYMLLRVFFSAACVYLLLWNRPEVSSKHRFPLGVLAVLYNPVLPVHLSNRLLWSLVNLGTVTYFWVLARENSDSETGVE